MRGPGVDNGRLQERQGCHDNQSRIGAGLMQRYSGEELGAAPRIVVLGSCKVGNYVKSTPLLRGLRQRWPSACIDFIGSEVTADFEQACPWITWRSSWDQAGLEASAQLAQALQERSHTVGPVDLAINLDGFNPVTQVLTAQLAPTWVAGGSLSANLRRDLPWGEEPHQRFLADPDWDRPEFLDRYRDHFSSNYIAELFCRLACIRTDFAAIELPWEDPGFPVPEVLIHATTARQAKIWPFAHWRTVVEHCSARGLRVGLVGSAPATQRSEYHSEGGEEALLASTELIDLRGQTSLIQLAGACRQARAVVSVDAGPLHIAAAVGTPTLAVVGNDAQGDGASPIRLWLPRVDNLDRTVSEHRCTLCADNRFRNDACLVDGHPCMQQVAPEQVLNWLARHA
ncbi:glycosyltransferase family 9 protein [Synechococcus sp. PROS-7-1]|uniref:glycosyltransferase family 9 protein n=1 Tax=Synechococcus sp. PROS-7-1 TaxID=1442556 RepID=UPI0021056C4E|nr:glycosyltransferase family 9 protein [Synechococcus sp. PROS-7-1]